LEHALSDNIFLCASCGENHVGLAQSFAADFPDRYPNLSREERDTRAVISSDQCIIDQEEFYIRGCLEIPILGAEEPFIWGLWARVKEEDFDDLSANWEASGREFRSGPYKGRLANALAIYAQTFNLRLEMRVRPVGTRPLFWIEDESELADLQRNGMTWQRASEQACLLMRMYGY
jgi:hypothetical protein